MIHILDAQTDELLGYLDGNGEKIYIDDEHEDEIDGLRVLKFRVPSHLPETVKIEERQRILVPHERTGWQELICYEASTRKKFKTITAIGSEAEIDKLKVVYPKKHVSLTLRQYVDFGLDGLDWKAGEILLKGVQTLEFTDHLGGFEFLKRIATAFDVELVFRIEVKGNRVIGRYVDMVESIGADSGKEFIDTKDLIDVEIKVNTQEIVTALIVLGPDKEDGTPMDPVIVTDNDAFKRWNRDGQHLFGIHQVESDDSEMTVARLTTLGKTELKKRIASVYEYIVEAVDISPLFPHEVAYLGDRVGIKNTKVDPPLYAQARIIGLKRPIRKLTDEKPRVKTYTIGEVVRYSKDEMAQAFKRYQGKYGTKVIKSDIPPVGSPNIIWIRTGSGLNFEIPHVWMNGIWNPFSPTTAEQIGAETPGGAQAKADEVLRQARVEIKEVSDVLTDFQGEINSTFRDGIIEEAEAIGIDNFKKTLNTEKADVDADFTAMNNNLDLIGTTKATLETAKTNYNTAHTALLGAVNMAILDGKTTKAETANVNSKFEPYRQALAAYSTALTNAQNAIAQKQAKDAEEAAKEFTEEQLTSFVPFIKFTETLADIQTQIDGSITTFFETGVPTVGNYPANEWTDVKLKNAHIGDVYYDRATNFAYRYMLEGTTYKWERIADSDVVKALTAAAKAQDTADGKRRVFYNQPAPPYDVGDLWAQGATGDLMRCAVSKVTGQTYAASDWVIGTKYTDDTKANAAAAAAKTAQDAADAANGKLADIASDNKLTANEKQEIKREWDVIVSEKAGIDAQGTTFGISTEKTAFNTAYATLNTYITPLLADLTATSTIVGTTFRSTFKAYYDARQALLNKVTEATKAYTDKQVSEIVIGGRNLLKASQEMNVASTDNAANTTRTFADGINTATVLVASAYWNIYRFIDSSIADADFFLNISKGDSYTLSADVKFTSTNPLSGVRMTLDVRSPDGAITSDAKIFYDTGGKWARVSTTLKSVPRGVQTKSLLLFSASENARVTVGDKLEIKNIKLEKGNKATDWTPAPEDVTAEISGVKDSVKSVSDALAGFQTTITSTFKDGIIEEAEAKAIEKYKNTVDTEKLDLDNRYTKVYGDTSLTGTPKTNLATAKTAYNTAYTNLMTAISNAISDGKTSTAEKADVDTKFTAYRTTLGTMSTRLEEAILAANAARDKVVQDAAALDAAAKVSAIKIGMRNIMANSNFAFGAKYWGLAGYSTILPAEADKPNSSILQFQNTAAADVAYTSYIQNTKRPYLSPKVGDSITVSFDFFCEDLATLGPNNTLFTIRRSDLETGGTLTSLVNPSFNASFGITESNKWVRVGYTYTFTASTAVPGWFAMGPYLSIAAGKTARYKFREFKVELGNKVTEWSPAPEDNDEMIANVRTEIGDVSTALNGLNNLTNTAFKDGIIDIAEREALASNIQQLNTEKTDVDNQYLTIYANVNLLDPAKANLATVKTAYNTAHTNLLNSINAAIADSAITPAEKTDVDAKYTAYRTALANVRMATEEAMNSIIAKLSTDAQAAAELYAEAQAAAVYDSENLKNLLDGKADAEQVGNLITKDELAQKEIEIDDKINSAIENQDLTEFAKGEDVDKLREDLKNGLSASTGVNILRNSIGYANLDFWNFTTTDKNVKSIMNEELSKLGFGAGFFFPANGAENGIEQIVAVTPGQPIILSWFLNKTTNGSFLIQILEDGAVTLTVPDAPSTGADFETNYIPYTPLSGQIAVRLTAAATTEATITGLMLSIGELPTQWALANGELYNAYVRVDERGLIVMRINADGEIEGYTNMSPEEFAIYYDENKDGTFEKMFWFDKDQTVTKKLVVLDEIAMGTVKAVRVDSATNRGWAIVARVPD